MRADQDGRDALLRQIHQQLVQLDGQEALFGHRVQIAVEAVDDDDLDARFFDRLPDAMAELARATAPPGSTWTMRDRPALSLCASRSMLKPAQRLKQGVGALVEHEHRRPSGRGWRPRTQNCAAIVDLPVPAPPTISVLVPSSMPPPSSASSSGIARRQLRRVALTWRCSAATSRGNTVEAALADQVVVIAAAELRCRDT